MAVDIRTQALQLCCVLSGLPHCVLPLRLRGSRCALLPPATSLGFLYLFILILLAVDMNVDRRHTMLDFGPAQGLQLDYCRIPAFCGFNLSLVWADGPFTNTACTRFLCHCYHLSLPQMPLPPPFPLPSLPPSRRRTLEGGTTNTRQLEDMVATGATAHSKAAAAPAAAAARTSPGEPLHSLFSGGPEQPDPLRTDWVGLKICSKLYSHSATTWQKKTGGEEICNDSPVGQSRRSFVGLDTEHLATRIFCLARASRATSK